MASLSTAERRASADALGLSLEKPAPAKRVTPFVQGGLSDQEIIDEDNRERPGFGTSFAAAFRVDNAGRALYENFTDPQFTFDLDFNGAEYLQNEAVKPRVATLTGADQEELVDKLAGAANKDHFEFLLKRFERKQADEATIADARGVGLAARLSAGLVDIDLPLALIPALGVSAKAGRLVKGLKTAAIAGGTNATIEAINAADNPFRDETDVFFAAAAGIVLGGSLGALSKGENARIEQMANEGADHGLDSVGAARRVFDGEGEDVSRLNQSAEDFLDEILEGVDAPNFKFAIVDKLTTNLRGKVTDGVEEVRALGSKMLEGGFVNKADTRSFTAEGFADRVDRALGLKFMARTQTHFQDWVKSKGKNGFVEDFTVEAGEEFYSQVGRAMKGLDDADITPQAKAAAAEQAKVLREVFDLAQKHKVAGFEGDPLDNFFPRIYDKPAFNRAINEHGEGAIRQYFKEAIISGQGADISEKLAGLFAKGMVRTILKSARGIDQGFTHGMPLDDIARIREIVTDGMTGSDLAKANKLADDIEAELKIAREAKGGDAGKIDRAKQRVRLDEGFSGLIKGRDGNAVDLKFSSLVHNDSRAVGLRYIQVLAGHIGLAKETGIKSSTDFTKAMEGIQSKAAARGEDAAAVNRQIEALTRGRDLLIGRSVENDPSSVGSQLSRSFRDFNFNTSSGSFGLAQIAEYGNFLTKALMRGPIRSIKEFSNLTKRAQDGTLENKVAAQVEEWFGAGGDFIRHPAIRGFDEFGEGFDGQSAMSRFLKQADVPLQIGKRIASAVSLMAPIIARMEKQASVSHILEFTDLVQKGKAGFSDAKRARWRGAGLTDEMQANVFEQIKKHAKFKNGILTDMGVEKWDFDVADAYASGVRRQASFTVQRNDISDIPESMRSPVGRLVFQFKAFMFGSIVKQLERGIHYKDVETFVAFTSSVFIASTVYIGQTYLETIGDPEKRAEMLQAERIFGAGFARAGWTALMVPPAATMADIMGYDKMFNARFSGLQASLLSFDQNPTSRFVGNTLGTAKALTLDQFSEDSRGFDQQDGKKALSLLPFNRVLGVKNALHALEE